MRILYYGLCALMILAGAASAAPRMIADDAALRTALRAGVAGDELVLAPGTYAPFTLEKGEAPAVIRSADPKTPAVLEGFVIEHFDGLRLEGLLLAYPFDPADKLNVRPFNLNYCKNLAFVGNRIRGELAHGTGTLADGHGYGIGLSVRFCEGVLIEGNHFSDHHRGMIVSESRDVLITKNEVTAIRMDGMVFAQLRDTVIENNYIHSFDRVVDSPDHADMIQFWTASTKEPTRNITIRNNLLNSGSGAFTQSIFMRNELVDKGQANEEMFYRDILIEQNIIINAQLHGISIGEARGLTIRHNTLVQNPRSAGGDPSQRVWTPAIRVADRSTDVRVLGNIVSDARGYEGHDNWQVFGNLIVQNQFGARPNHYSHVFANWPAGDPTDPATYRLAPGVPPVGAPGLHN
jgi:hypothetical protein